MDRLAGSSSSFGFSRFDRLVDGAGVGVVSTAALPRPRLVASTVGVTVVTFFLSKLTRLVGASIFGVASRSVFLRARLLFGGASAVSSFAERPRDFFTGTSAGSSCASSTFSPRRVRVDAVETSITAFRFRDGLTSSSSSEN